MIDGVCKNCRFYKSMFEECRLLPRVRLPRQFVEGATPGNRVRDEAILWGYPKHSPDDWCGKWEYNSGIER